MIYPWIFRHVGWNIPTRIINSVLIVAVISYVLFTRVFPVVHAVMLDGPGSATLG